MPLTFECSQFAVFDDALAAAHHEALWRYLQFTPLKAVDLGTAYSPWHVTDGQPLKGPSAHVTSDWVGLDRRGAAPPPSARPGAYPTNTPVDAVLERLLDLAPALPPWIGTPGVEWALCSAKPWIYPAGAGLSWHSDGAGYSGAFIYYAHPAWDAQWGGELLVADEACRLSYSSSPTQLTPFSEEERSAYRFDKAQMNRHLLGPGIGRVVMAKPNRLIVLQGGNPHKISRVDPAAGDHVRASIAGFFVAPELAGM